MAKNLVSSSQLSYVRGDGTLEPPPATSGALVPSNNLSDVSSTSASLSNLGGLSLAGGTLTGAFVPAVSALTDGATISVNAALGNVFTVSIAGSRTIAAPTNATAGQVIEFDITQGAGGSHTLTWTSSAGGFSFGGGSAPTLSTSAGAVDLVAFRYNAGKSLWLYLGSQTGF